MPLIPRFFSAREEQHPQQSGRAPTTDRLEIEDLIERLEESRIGELDGKHQRGERSQEVVENKGQCFFHSLQSQEVFENKGVIFVKPRGC